MSTMQFEKITDAVHRCLAGCYAAKSPLAHLAEFADELHRDSNWREWEVFCVEKTVRRMLMLIATPADEGVENDLAPRRTARRESLSHEALP
jgi:hypothetical protein